MTYKIIPFLNNKEIEAVNIIRSQLKEQYWLLSKVRLSEFLYSTQESGSSAFYDEFKIINLITLPLVIFDTLSNKIEMVISFDMDLDGVDIIESVGIKIVYLDEIKDVLRNVELVKFYDD